MPSWVLEKEGILEGFAEPALLIYARIVGLLYREPDLRIDERV